VLFDEIPSHHEDHEGFGNIVLQLRALRAFVVKIVFSILGAAQQPWDLQ